MSFVFRIPPSGYAIEAPNDQDTILWDAATGMWTFGAAGAVSSVFGRVGAVVAQTGDYDSDQIDNVSSVAGASVSDALETLAASGGAVSSVFTRTGAILAVAGDYTTALVTNTSAVPGATGADALNNLEPASAKAVAALPDSDAVIATTTRLALLQNTLTNDRTYTVTPSAFAFKTFRVDIGTQPAGNDAIFVNGGATGGSVTIAGNTRAKLWITSDGANVVFLVEELGQEPVL